MASIMTVRAPDRLQNTLNQAAKQRGLTRNALILQILQDWIERKEKLAWKLRQEKNEKEIAEINADH